MQPKSESTDIRRDANNPPVQPAAGPGGTTINAQLTFDQRQVHLPGADFQLLMDPERLAQLQAIDPTIVSWIMGEVSKNAEHRRTLETLNSQAAIDDRRQVRRYGYFGVAAAVVIMLSASGSIVFAITSNAPTAAIVASFGVLTPLLEAFRRLVVGDTVASQTAPASAPAKAETPPSTTRTETGSSGHRTKGRKS